MSVGASQADKACPNALTDHVQRFSVECVLLAIDYITHRQGGADVCENTRLYSSDSSRPWGDQHLFRESAVVIRRTGQKVEFCRRHISLFKKFEKTLCALESKADPDCLSKKFTEDLMSAVFGCQPSSATWDEIVLAIVMTAAFVRHVTDGRLCSQYVKALLEGLLGMIKRLGEAKFRCLGSWCGMIQHYAYHPCAPLPAPCPKQQTAVCTHSTLSVNPDRSLAETLRNCYEESSSPCVKKVDSCNYPDPSPCPPDQYSRLSVTAEARELVLDLIQCSLNINISYLSHITCKPKPPALERRMLLLRKNENNFGATRIVSEHSSKLTCVYHSYKNNDLLRIKLQEYLQCNILSKILSSGWQAVIAAFLLVKGLIQTARCDNCQTQDYFLCIIEALCAAIKCSESAINSTLRGWTGFEEQFGGSC